MQSTSAIFETLYFLQKNEFYKKLYYFSRIWSALITAQLLICSTTGWTVADWLSTTLLYLSLPVYLLPLTGFAIIFALVVVLIVISAGLILQITYQIHKGTMDSHRVTKILRFSLGLVATFGDPITTAILSGFACNWVDSDPNNTSYINCSMNAYRAIFVVVSTATSILFVFCVLLSNVMHVNDPKSSMILSRAHARIDLFQAVTSVILASVTAFLPEQITLLGSLYIVAQTVYFAALVVFQPFYHPFTNDLFTGLSAITVWVGICYMAWIPTQADSATAIALYVGFIPFGLIGFYLSYLWRGWIIKRTLKAFPKNREVPSIPDDNFYPVIRAAYDRNITTPMWVDMEAAMVEVKTRFLQFDQSPRAVEMADYIMRTGLMKFPQSAYLRMHYLTFLISYRDNIGMVITKIDELSSVHWDLDMQFSLVRKKRELERQKQVKQLGSESMNMDSISFEELKKKIRDAREGHKKAVQLSADIWSTLFRKLGGASKDYKKKMKASKYGGFGRRRRKAKPKVQTQVKEEEMVVWDNSDSESPGSPNMPHRHHHQQQQHQPGFAEDDMLDHRWQPIVAPHEVQAALDYVAPMLEQLQQITAQTNKEYEGLVTQCSDSSEVLLDYSKFLREVKKDHPAADEYEEKANMLNTEVDGKEKAREETSSIAKSATATGSTTSNTAQRQQMMIQKETTRITNLKNRLRFITALMVGALSGAFISYYVTQAPVAQDTFFTVNESGLRRSGCSAAAYDLRTMHIAALKGDNATFYSMGPQVVSNIEISKTNHYNLMFVYTSAYKPLVDYLHTQSVPALMAGDGTLFKTVLLSPDELFNRMMDLGQIAATQSISKFAAFNISNPNSFTELHFVLANTITCIRNFDTVTSMYRDQSEYNTEPIQTTVIAMTIIVGLVELFAVLAVFRPIVAKMFQEFWNSIARFAEIPLPVVIYMAQSARVQLKKTKAFAGDGDGGDPQDELMSEFSGEDRQAHQYSKINFAESNGNKNSSNGGLQSRRMVVDVPASEFDAPNSASGGLTPHSWEASTPKLMATRDSGFGFAPAPKNRARFGNSLPQWAESPFDSGENTPASSVAPSPGPARLSPGPRPFVTQKSAGNLHDEFEDEDDDEANQVKITGPLHVRVKLLTLRMIHKFKNWVNSEEDDDSHEKQSSNRKLIIQIVYFSLLCCIWAFLMAFCVVCLASIHNLRHSCAELNGVGRRRFMFDMISFWSRELRYSNDSRISLISPTANVTYFLDETAARKTLEALAGASQIVHSALMFGQVYGLNELPIARGFPADLINSPYSMLTPDSALLLSSNTVPGFVTKGEFADYYFRQVCLTTNEFAPGDIALTDVRMNYYTTWLSDTACELYNANNPIASNGMHRFFEEVTQLAYRLSHQKFDQYFFENYNDLELIKNTTDMKIGLQKAMQMIQNDSLLELDGDNQIIIIMFVVAIILIVLQYVVLGTRIQFIMYGNLEISLTADRMLGDAVHKMVFDGYDTSLFLDIIGQPEEEEKKEEDEEEGEEEDEEEEEEEEEEQQGKDGDGGEEEEEEQQHHYPSHQEYDEDGGGGGEGYHRQTYHQSYDD